MELQRVSAAILSAAICASVSIGAQMTSGQKITARDGDTIVISNDDRVRIVRRRDANVRALYIPQLKRLVLLVDYALSGGEPDGRVDEVRNYDGLEPVWPLGERWEARSTVHEYSLVGHSVRPIGMALTTPMGLVQLAPALTERFDSSAVASFSFRGSGISPTRGLSFDETQQEVLAGRSVQPHFSTFTALPADPRAPAMAGAQPVRVGGNIKPPAKIHDVRPVYPDHARSARITGMVVLEATIGVDGAVTAVRVVRSIPQLDAAAIEAVKQWRFEPTLLNGAPVPVIMTVTVDFNLE